MSEARISRVAEAEIALEPFDWPFAREAGARIAAHWAQALARKPALFDGRVLLLRRREIVGDAFRGGCFETAFSAFMSWRDFGFPDQSVRNFFGMAALRAEDGAFLLGEMGPQTANAGQVYFPAGTPDLEDVRDGRADLAGSVVRELEEETGLRAEDCAVAGHWTLVEQGAQIAFMREIVVPGSAADAAARIEANLASQDHPELTRIHVVRAPEAAEGLRMPPFMLPYLRFAFAQPG